ncbi:outer membrane protein assembly factor BamB [Aliikangiella maris]|uniref:Outer membrane protein assembly factor BamB n=2 Tax=Aliikangiella maris TaxID=3162458 RepID=A0ABV3MS61_9GAMM
MALVNNSVIRCLLLLTALIVAGCSDEVDIYEPDPLVDLDNQFETKVLWKTSIGDGTNDKTVKLSPVYAYQKIFVADGSGNVAAVNPDNGEVIWQTELNTVIGGGPAVANNIVAVGTTQGEVIVLNAADGTEKWRRAVSSEIITSPAVGDGYVVVRSVNDKLTAFDAESGEQQWLHDQTMPSLTLRGDSSPVIVGGGVISGFSNGKLAVFLLDSGRLAWEKTITAPVGYSEIQKLVDVDVKPLVSGTNVYVAAYNGNLTSIEASNGQAIWQRELSTFQEITLSELILLVTHENSHVSAVDKSNGVILWTQKALHRRQLSAPESIGDNVVVTDFEGYLHWLSRKDGTLVSREHIDSDGISAVPLVIDNKVILFGHSGNLYAVAKR